MVHPGTWLPGGAETVQEDRRSHFPWQPTPNHGLNRSPRFPRLAWRKRVGKPEVATVIGRPTAQRPEFDARCCWPFVATSNRTCLPPIRLGERPLAGCTLLRCTGPSADEEVAVRQAKQTVWEWAYG